MLELKPCPFCGNDGKPELIHADIHMWYVKCTKCGACCKGGQLSAEIAVKAWNTRAERTCHMERVFLYDEECVEGIECSECGWSGEHSHIKSLPEYCQSCGAKVVKEKENKMMQPNKESVLKGESFAKTSAALWETAVCGSLLAMIYESTGND